MNPNPTRVNRRANSVITILTTALLGSLALLPQMASAQVNILLVGSDTDTARNPWYTPDPTVSTFDAYAVRTQLQGILGAAGLGAVNVTLEDRFRQQSLSYGGLHESYNLLSWFHWPFPAGNEWDVRWPNLRNEGATQWDHVVLIEDSYTIERTPGLYAQAVAMIGEEVEKAGKKPVLLMTWPGQNSTSSIDHYKEVNYRIGQSADYAVAPAGLAFQASGAPLTAAHPSSPRGAYIAAATLYSRLYNAVAPSSYNPGYSGYQTDATTAFNTVQNLNNTPPVYKGPYEFVSTYRMLHDKRRQILFNERGTSTEDYIREKAVAIGNDQLRVNTVGANSGNISSNWPRPIAWNHGRDGVFSTSESSKSYLVNPDTWSTAYGFAYHPRVHGETAAHGNDVMISHMFRHDVRMDYHMRTNNQLPSARVVPLRTLWAALHRQYPNSKPTRDSFNHLQHFYDHAAASYMHTMFSGRAPIGVAPATMTSTYWGQKVGYEAAWRMGNLQTRAPGFRVLPSAITALSVTPDTTETMEVNFIMQPRENVTVRISATPESAVTITPRTLTFTPDNHDLVRNIRFQGMPGADPSQSVTIRFDTESDDVVYEELFDEWDYTVNRSSTQTVSVVEGDTISLFCGVNGSVGLEAIAGATVDNTTFIGPFNGTVSMTDESINYIPNPDFTGADSFAYTTEINGTITRTYVELLVVIPSIEIRGNGTTISSGDVTPAAADGTDFGMITSAGPVDREFTIHNLSDFLTLSMSDNPRVSIVGGGGAITLLEDAAGTVNPGGQTSFRLRYAPTAEGVHTATIRLVSSDPVFPDYTFRVTGARVVAPTVTNQPASSIGNKSARINGQLTAGQKANAILYWGTTNGVTTPANWQNATPIVGVTGSFSHLATGLVPGTTYYFRAYVSNPAGAAWATSTTSFSTISAPPVFGDILDIPNGIETDLYEVNLAEFVTDADLPSDTLTFTKQSGPAWLSVSPVGILSGTPARTDLGEHTITVRVTDSFSNFVEAQFTMEVEGLTLIPLLDGFEPPQVVIGGIHSQNGWLATEQAQIQTDIRFAGNQSLQLNTGSQVYQRFSPQTSNVVWIDGRVRLENFADVIDVPIPESGAAAWFFNSSGQLTVLNGNNWSLAPGQPAVSNGQWVRVTMALDYTAQTWRIFLNGQLAQDNLPLVGMPTRLAKFAISGQDSYVDDVSVTYQTPAGIETGVGTTPSMILATGPISFAYNGSPQGPATTVVQGSTSLASYSYRGTGSTSYGPSADKPVNAGTYEVLASVAGDANFAGAMSAPYAFTISPAPEGAPEAPLSGSLAAMSEPEGASDVSSNQWAQAEGGEINQYIDELGNAWTVHVFTASGESGLTITRPGRLEYLVVGGGGAGGRARGGGGGGGGLQQGSMSVSAATTIPIFVGEGGFANNTISTTAGQGHHSSLGDIVALGGGRGGRYPAEGIAAGVAATVGGSGGGGGGSTSTDLQHGGSGTTGQGNAGGNGATSNAGGGGGAGAAGATAVDLSDGGDGLQSDITGELKYYAGGGGGFRDATRRAVGGQGGGGIGAYGLTSTTLIAEDGAANTGGGGGGGNNATAVYGGNGASGIVIVRYQAPWARAEGGEVSYSEDEEGNLWRVHAFTNTATDTLTVTREGFLEYLVVGGGGAGGRARGGGGGAGGMLQGAINCGSGTLPVTVGAGGLGGSGSGVGQDSVLGDLIAKGGGNGGRHPVTDNPSVGGSGGGGGGRFNSTTHGVGAAGTEGQGYKGGTSTSTSSPGSAGGGGAGAEGQSVSGSTGGTGGNGLQSPITGTLTWYAGGGGGMSHSGTTNIPGGLGGGGRGARTLTGTTDYATSGEPNTGGGGGGAGNISGINGGDGGTGVVIIRYQIALPTMFVAE